MSDANEVLPYGTWPTPVTPELIVQASVGLGEVAVQGRTAWWSELRPEEGGRVQVVRRPLDAAWPATEVLPSAHSARTRVHEYGGGAWWVHGDTLVFANWDDQRLYRFGPGDDTPVPLTRPAAVPHGLRYADGTVTPDGAWTVCVRESHEAPGEAVNEVVAVALTDPGDTLALVTGPDFVAAPRISPDGRWLAWLQWQHPDMPWDGTELWVAGLATADGDVEVTGAHRVAGGRAESVVQPTWSPAGVLHFLTDRDGYWQLHRLASPGGGGPDDRGVRVWDLPADVGTPPWVFGMQRYAFLDEDGSCVAAVASRDGADVVHVVATDPTSPEPDRATARLIDVGATAVSSVASDGRGGLVAVASSFTREPAVVVADGLAALAPTGPDDTTSAAAVEPRLLRPPRDLGLEPAWWSVPRHVTFPTGPEGHEGDGDRRAHGLFYPPTNPHCVGPDDERPPLLVAIHGGPTAAARSQLQLGIQFWTSRGFAVVDVNYRGSTGYGRAFRELLDGQWGVTDVEDCAAAAAWLAAEGEVDGDRLAIHGGSAGGFTTLMALIRTDRFSAGTSSYGVTDLEALAKDTHKFESRYLDGLVGEYPARYDRYVERSPIHHLDELDDPVLLLQGLEDEIVPPSQAELLVEALRRNGVPFAYLAFEGEQHGFRQAATIRRALEAELFFYARVFGFEPPEGVEPVEIENLPTG